MPRRPSRPGSRECQPGATAEPAAPVPVVQGDQDDAVLGAVPEQIRQGVGQFGRGAQGDLVRRLRGRRTSRTRRVRRPLPWASRRPRPRLLAPHVRLVRRCRRSRRILPFRCDSSCADDLADRQIPLGPVDNCRRGHTNLGSHGTGSRGRRDRDRPEPPARRRRATSPRQGKDERKDLPLLPGGAGGQRRRGSSRSRCSRPRAGPGRGAGQGGGQLVGDGEGAGQRPEPLGGVAAVGRVHIGLRGVRQGPQKGQAADGRDPRRGSRPAAGGRGTARRRHPPAGPRRRDPRRPSRPGRAPSRPAPSPRRPARRPGPARRRPGPKQRPQPVAPADVREPAQRPPGGGLLARGDTPLEVDADRGQPVGHILRGSTSTPGRSSSPAAPVSAAGATPSGRARARRSCRSGRTGIASSSSSCRRRNSIRHSVVAT